MYLPVCDTILRRQSVIPCSAFLCVRSISCLLRIVAKNVFYCKEGWTLQGTNSLYDGMYAAVSGF